MKDSIRTRLFLGIIALTLIFTGASWLVNSLFGKDFYLFSKKQKLSAIANEIEILFDGNGFIDKLAIERIEYEKNVHISLFNKDYQQIYDSLFPGPPSGFYNNNVGISTMPPFQSFGISSIRMPPLPAFLCFPNTRGTAPTVNIGSPFTLYERHDRRLNIDYLEYVCKLKNDHTLNLFVPIAPITESANLANSLSLISGLFSLFIGSILALIFTTWFSRPIIALKTIAEHMARLDFSHKYIEKRKDEVGDLGRSINILSDQLNYSISGLEAANNKLKNDIMRERKLEAMRKNFISSVSHELKTPLALIQGYAEGLRSNIVHGKRKRNEYCGIIIDEAMKMNRLIKDLLDLSLLDSGNFSIQSQPVNIYQLTERIIEKFKPIFKAQEVNFKKEIKYRDYVYADPVRIEQVFINYINNALYHLDQHERIIKITIESHESCIRIAVYNSGKPIPEQELKNIWVSFYKIDKARTRQSGSTGLGLSIVRSIMSLHKTAYGVINKKNGVEFWFNLNKDTSRTAVSS